MNETSDYSLKTNDAIIKVDLGTMTIINSEDKVHYGSSSYWNSLPDLRRSPSPCCTDPW